MKRFLITAATWITAAALPVFGDSTGIAIGKPGFYGHIDINGYPRPEVYFQQPVSIGHVPLDAPIVYLHVPSDHVHNWPQHCHEYNACNEKVMFVKSTWYIQQYVPRYQQQHSDHRGLGGDHRQQHGPIGQIPEPEQRERKQDEHQDHNENRVPETNSY